LIAVGYTNSFYSGLDIWARAFDAATGVVLWTYSYNGPLSGDDEARRVTIWKSGGAIWVAGYQQTALAAGTGSYPPFASWFNFAPAKWDPWGMWGPAGNFLVYDTPFLTHAATVTPVLPTVKPSWSPARKSVILTVAVSVLSSLSPRVISTSLILDRLAPTLTTASCSV